MLQLMILFPLLFAAEVDVVPEAYIIFAATPPPFREQFSMELLSLPLLPVVVLNVTRPDDVEVTDDDTFT